MLKCVETGDSRIVSLLFCDLSPYQCILKRKFNLCRVIEAYPTTCRVNVFLTYAYTLEIKWSINSFSSFWLMLSYRKETYLRKLIYYRLCSTDRQDEWGKLPAVWKDCPLFLYTARIRCQKTFGKQD